MGKYHEFVAICIVMSISQTSDIFLAWYYSDHDFIIRTFDFIARSNTTHVTCSTHVVHMSPALNGSIVLQM